VSEEHAEATDPAGEQPAGEPAEEQPAPAEDPVAALTRERDDYLDQQGLAARAHERLVKELVPVLDDLERALEAAARHEDGKLEDGVRLVHRSLADALAKEGLAEIETGGAFDPHTQEALLSQPSEAEEGSVIQVLQKGYSLGDRVLRPARVVISAGPPSTEDGPQVG
jgi:molecular chaperone GrpE